MNKDRYIIISPCRNEERYMRKTLDSVVSQTIRPSLWVIVDDGSSDDTPGILKKYASEYSFIRVVTRRNRGYRSVGPGVIDAFYAGYETVNIDDFDYLCKLDLDLVLPHNYFEQLIRRMEANPRLGNCSGKPYYTDSISGKLVSEHCGDENAIGASKFYRVSCFKQIGGFIRQVMWDGIDGHHCRMLGWIACSSNAPELRFIHLRPMGSSQKNILTGRIRHGFGQYFMGTGIIYITASTIYRMNKRPYVIGGLCILYGYMLSLVQRKPRLKDENLTKFIRKFQWSCLIRGKAKAIERINDEQISVWKEIKN